VVRSFIVDILTKQNASVKIEAMNVELTRGRALRAAKHAALSDEVRLHIVDLLAPADISSTELQAVLGIGSNLLAHHLKVLEQAGLVARHRSEADRRRSYVRILPSGFDLLTPVPVDRADRVVFVCTANSARSQLAAALWRRASEVPVVSAGTHPAERVEPGAVDVARRRGLPFTPVRPVALDAIRLDTDLIITVCDSAHEELAGGDALHWSVPDPVRSGTQDAFDAAFDDLVRRIDDLAPQVVTTRLQSAPAEDAARTVPVGRWGRVSVVPQIVHGQVQLPRELLTEMRSCDQV
jgi:protein-tyrosine-phosphatase/DNA-binding HxlR family transcriptional regulator